MVLAGGELGGRRYLRPDSIAAMTRLQSGAIDAADSGFGLGFRVTRYRGRRVLCHEGGNPGIAARLCMLPDEGFATAVLVNSQNEGLPYRIVNQILDQFLGEAGAFEPQRPRREPSREPVAQFTGRYRGVDLLPDQLSIVEPMMQFPVVERDGLLRIEGFMGEEKILEPTEKETVFIIHAGLGAGEPVVFQADADGTMNIYASIVHLRRVPFYARTPTLAVAAAVVVALGFVIRWRVRRPGTRRTGGHEARHPERLSGGADASRR